MSENSSKKLFLLDAYALIYRSYYAFIRNPRFNSKGVNTSAMFGFTNTLVQVLESEKPDYIGVVFDPPGPTFRHEMFPQYKANREEMPEDLRKAVPYIKKIIEAFNIPIVEKAGFEADDVIGTLAKKAENEGFTVYMMTPDKDYAQLVTDKKLIYRPGKAGNDNEVWGINEVKANFGVETAEQIIDLLGLMGDASDNIPDCPGIGPKSAEKLIAEFGGIEGVYKNIDSIKGKQKENLVEFEEQVRHSRILATIIQDVPVDFDEKALIREDLNKEALKAIFEDLEFRTLSQRLKLDKKPNTTPVNAVQNTLFDMPMTAEILSKKLNTIETIPHQYYLVETEMQRASLRAELSVQEAFCFDTETTGLETQSSDIVCVSFSFRKHEAYCVLVPSKRDDAHKVLEEFREVFADERITKIGQNLKYDMLMLSNYGIKVKGRLYDTMLAHYLIQPELKHNLDYIYEIYLDYQKITTDTLIGKKGEYSMRSAPKDKLRDYSCEDADLTFRLKFALDPEVDKAGVRDLFETLEMPLVPVLVHMENAGVKINTDELKNYAEVLREQIIGIEKEIFALAGEEFNISSPKQMGPILYEKLKIDPNVKKTKTQQYPTAEDVLEKLADRHPIINKILDFRGLKKLLSTYIEALPKMINTRTGKIHTSYNQALVATGRLSSTNPNLQNIPIRDENGREIRRAFIPSSDENIFLSADYSQIELRIMAALSKDVEMLKAFSEKKDIHSITASKIYGIPESQVDSDMRRKAKTANFGIIYGISAFGLSQRLNITRTEAKQLIDGYFENFPRIRQFMDEQIAMARKQGYVQTIKGRKRYLSDINSANAVVRGMAERNAINAPIQGSAADIIKIAMINIYRQFEKMKLKSKMVMQVHDELNFDVSKAELEQVKQIIKVEMENAVELGVPLTVEMDAAANWLDAH